MRRSYTELSYLDTHLDRFRYLKLNGRVGQDTFGHDRYINQMFYNSAEWKQVRHHVIARDLGCDLGIEGYDIYNNLHIHHMNPMRFDDIKYGDDRILDPEYLITTSQRTHNAIHYGDEKQLPRPLAVRRPGDTKLW